MVHTLRNSEFEVKIKAKGAELCSFRNLKNNTEYIWQGDAKIWPRHAPVLFPIVGRLPEHKYLLHGKSYHLPQHGFARDHIFEPVETSETSLTMELKWSELTLPHYPFHFRLLASFKLEGNSLNISYKVQNLDENDMPFSIGAHPGFKVPLSEGKNFTDYYLEFSEPQSLDRHLLHNGLLSGQTETVPVTGKNLPLRRELFEQDAIVLKNNKIEKVTLKSDSDPRSVEVSFSNYPYLGIWSPFKEGADFICIEPWHGITSNEGEISEISQKEGIMNLPAGQKFECGYQISVS